MPRCPCNAINYTGPVDPDKPCELFPNTTCGGKPIPRIEKGNPALGEQDCWWYTVERHPTAGTHRLGPHLSKRAAKRWLRLGAR